MCKLHIVAALMSAVGTPGVMPFMHKSSSTKFKYVFVTCPILMQKSARNLPICLSTCGQRKSILRSHPHFISSLHYIGSGTIHREKTEPQNDRGSWHFLRVPGEDYCCPIIFQVTKFNQNSTEDTGLQFGQGLPPSHSHSL